MVYLRSRLQLTILRRLWKPVRIAAFFCIRPGEPFPPILQGNRIIYPIGFEHFSERQHTCSGAKLIIQFPSMLYWKTLHLLSGFYDYRKEWYEKSSVNQGGTSPFFLETPPVHLVAMKLLERTWKSSHTCANQCFFVAFCQSQSAFKKVYHRDSWTRISCKYPHALFTLGKKREPTKFLMRLLTEKVPLWPWSWRFVLLALFWKVT